MAREQGVPQAKTKLAECSLIVQTSTGFSDLSDVLPFAFLASWDNYREYNHPYTKLFEPSIPLNSEIAVSSQFELSHLNLNFCLL
ncbi:hypothetical protein T265_11763 [Opisthorchis viverrini]|uniref:Uncharacterized protein n=1 Tax=Opisthorchis viverrini TaxID=6198 RepID=A0A074Z1V5_OPIVI|nr:hypothetical protein T265_11763 [Opisthorchis viverrini]KER19477.1 hypothetical protein T265_11763 [Opisthorchis viverrini]